MKSGFISVIGRPNVGKSTLINTIVGEKVAITTDKPQTTRDLIQGIYTDTDSQMVFVDTPGIHKPLHKLGGFLNSKAYYSVNDVDLILLVVDGSEGIGSGDRFIIERLKNVTKPVFLAINKIDKLKNEDILNKINEYKDLYDFCEIVPLSAEKNDNVDRLITTLKKYLPDNVKYFADDDKTSSTMDFRISEIVREKVMNLTEEEIPHSIACILTDYEEKNNIINIFVDIITDREALRKIILGKNGIKIKQIGIEARGDLERLLGKQVYLELYVRVLKKWRDKEKYLRELGIVTKHEL